MKIEFEGKYDKAEFYRAVALINGPSRRSMILRIIVLVILVPFTSLTLFLRFPAQNNRHLSWYRSGGM